MGITSSSIGVQVEDRQELLSGALALLRSLHPALSTFPDMAVRSACALSFLRFAGCPPALRPARSRCHRSCPAIRGSAYFVTPITAPDALRLERLLR